MPKRLATGPMLAALVFAVIATALIVIPYFEPSFTLGGNASLLAVVASVATVLMILLAAIVGSRQDDDDESLTEEDLVPTVAFGPGADLDADEDKELTRKERKERKRLEKEAKKEAERRAKFEREAKKEADKAAKKAEKAAKKAAKKGDLVESDSDWVSGLKDEAQTAGDFADASSTQAVEEEILETTSFQLPPPVDEAGGESDYSHAATASPMFEEQEDDEYLTAAYLDAEFEVPFHEYADAENAALESLGAPDGDLTDETGEIDEPDEGTIDTDPVELDDADEFNTDQDATHEDDEGTIMEHENTDPTTISARLEALTREMATLLQDATLESEELRGELTDLADSHEQATRELHASLHDARSEVDRLNEEYAAISGEKRDALALRSMLVDAENRAMRADIDREQMLARLRQARFAAADNADQSEILALLDKAFVEIDETASEAEDADNAPAGE